MASVKIIADSSVSLPKELIEGYGIELVPETIIFTNKVYQDGIDLVSQEFYSLLGQVKDFSITPAPSPQDFANAYQMGGCY